MIQNRTIFSGTHELSQEEVICKKKTKNFAAAFEDPQGTPISCGRKFLKF